LSARGAAGISTLAFLPLDNATDNPSVDYYAAGLTDGLTGQLGEATDVRIIAPASTARAARAWQLLAQTARRLGADAILAGRLRQAADRIAVDIRLVDAASGRVLWSDSYERSAHQVLALQADLIRALASAMRLTVRPTAETRLATVRAVNPEAYEAYLKGRYEWTQRTRESIDRAIAYFTRAIDLDPTYAPAHAALADCYNQFATVLLGTGSPREYRPRAATAAIRALQLDPYSAEGHATLGYVRHYERRWEEAEGEFRRAIELNPNLPLVRIWYANLLMSRGRMEAAVEQAFAARALDPFSLIVNTNLGWVLAFAGRHEEAVRQLQGTLELDSTYVQARKRLVDALMLAGRDDEAYEQAKRLVATSGRAPHMVTALAKASVRVGRTDEARSLLAELLARADSAYVPPFSIAEVYGAVGDIDSAMVWLARAYQEGSNAIAFLAIDPLDVWWRDDPRFHALLATAGLR
jgi:TolB-like protein